MSLSVLLRLVRVSLQHGFGDAVQGLAVLQALVASDLDALLVSVDRLEELHGQLFKLALQQIAHAGGEDDGLEPGHDDVEVHRGVENLEPRRGRLLHVLSDGHQHLEVHVFRGEQNKDGEEEVEEKKNDVDNGDSVEDVTRHGAERKSPVAQFVVLPLLEERRDVLAVEVHICRNPTGELQCKYMPRDLLK